MNLELLGYSSIAFEVFMMRCEIYSCENLATTWGKPQNFQVMNNHLNALKAVKTKAIQKINHYCQQCISSNIVVGFLLSTMLHTVPCTQIARTNHMELHIQASKQSEKLIMHIQQKQSVLCVWVCLCVCVCNVFINVIEYKIVYVRGERDDTFCPHYIFLLLYLPFQSLRQLEPSNVSAVLTTNHFGRT